MKTQDFLNAICDALGRAPNTLGRDDTPKTVEQWDSVGHLSIISTIDEALGVSVQDPELRSFQSIGELLDRLHARKALED